MCILLLLTTKDFFVQTSTMNYTVMIIEEIIPILRKNYSGEIKPMSLAMSLAMSTSPDGCQLVPIHPIGFRLVPIGQN